MTDNKKTKLDPKSEDHNGKHKGEKNGSKVASKTQKKPIDSDSDGDSIKVEGTSNKHHSDPHSKRKPESSADKLAKEASQNSNSKSSLAAKVIKTEEAATTSKWWEQSSIDEEIKWNTLEHKGVTFPPFYKPQKFPVRYDGKVIELNARQEEMAYYWSQTIGSEWETKDTYRKNFSEQFLKSFDRSLGYTSLDKFDFSAIVNYIAEQKELKKNKTAEDKKAEKAAKQHRDEYYGLAMVDADTEKIGGYAIEPPTLFKGRGKHPKAGFMKARILPEDITINIGEKNPVPRCDVPGHAWGEIVHNNTVTWLAFYKDDTINTTYKYIFLAASSKFKGISDRKKYDKARKLKDHIDTIRDNYKKKFVSKNVHEQQLGVACYLIDRLALRVGNEKSEDEADTVGTCSLRVEHIKVIEDNQITLDFLGKDSMRYFNTVTVDPQVHALLRNFTKGKSADTNLFHEIDAGQLNEYLRGMMEGLTAKVFRTYNASVTLEKELFKKDVSGLPLDEKVAYYDEANKQVAILCNHQKTVGKNFDQSMGKNKLKIDDMKEYLEQLKTHHKKVKKGEEGFDEDVVEKQVEKKLRGDDGNLKIKPIKRKFPKDAERVQDAIKNLEKKINDEEKKVTQREENKAIALGTSKLNYNDPRITVKWCKLNEVPIEKVFSKTVRSKFPWAMYTELDWKF